VDHAPSILRKSNRITGVAELNNKPYIYTYIFIIIYNASKSFNFWNVKQEVNKSFMHFMIG